MSLTHDAEHCLQKCGSGEPCDKSKCPAPEKTLTLHPPKNRTRHEHPAVMLKLDGLMSRLQEL